ncbi:MAG TPA: hypothetical protein VK039_05710 [Brevibacterium sp.]|nr:hypothetical protein [Brevibacterium sp.]
MSSHVHVRADAVRTVGPAVTVLIVPGPALGGPADLGPGLVRLLIDADVRGLQTVALAAAPSDLDAPPVALARLIATDDDDTAAEAVARAGVDRVLRVPDASPEAVGDWLARVPRVASRTLRRRVRTALRGFAPVRWAYERMGAR